MMFRRHGIFSEMLITHDIRDITKRPDASLSQQQRDLIYQIGKILTLLTLFRLLSKK